jgi:hypothetical protein
MFYHKFASGRMKNYRARLICGFTWPHKTQAGSYGGETPFKPINYLYFLRFKVRPRYRFFFRFFLFFFGQGDLQGSLSCNMDKIEGDGCQAV